MSLTFEWDEEMATGIEGIDEEHKEFLEIGKKSEELMKDKGLEGETVIKFHTEVLEFFDRHFKSEENIMDEIRYKRVTPHKEAHRNLRESISVIDLSSVNDDPLMPLIQIKSILQDTIWDHIYENDKDLAKEYRRYQKLFKHMDKAKQEELAENERKFGVVIKEDNMTIAYLMWDQTYKGNAILVNKEKNTSLLRLSTLEYNTFLSDLMRLMRAIAKTYSPDDIEVLMTNDVDGQFCVHVVPKYKDNEEYGKIYSRHDDFERWSKEEYEKHAALIAENF